MVNETNAPTTEPTQSAVADTSEDRLTQPLPTPAQGLTVGGYIRIADQFYRAIRRTELGDLVIRQVVQPTRPATTRRERRTDPLGKFAGSKRKARLVRMSERRQRQFERLAAAAEAAAVKDTLSVRYLDPAETPETVAALEE